MQLPDEASNTQCRACGEPVTELDVALHGADGGPIWQAKCPKCGTGLGYVEERDIPSVFGGLGYER